MVSHASHCDLLVRRGSDRPSGYNFPKLVKHFFRLVMTSGTRPLRLIPLLGVFAILMSLALGGYALWNKLTAHVSVEGWTSLLIVICFFSGCILASLGIIAEYLGLMFTMTLGRPLYVVVPRPSGRKAA
jgi:undecaprenyl-phosphate 4-deoxy-4-formamido-L-arabinose transferase